MDQRYTPDSPFKPETLVQLLRDQATRQPDHPAVIFLRDGEEREASLTYGELDRQARSVASWLQREHLTGGRQALLLYPPGLDFIITFFGCLYAGIVAVPVYPPRLNRPSARIQAIVADSEATVALTTTKIYEGLARRFSQMPGLVDLHWLNTEEMPDHLAESWQEPQITPGTLAFLQYTSGSTGSPKGVMLTHANLLHNLELIRRGFQLAPGEGGAFWLPTYHDMGLIGGVLEPFYIGGTTILMAPAAFLQRPVRWLQAISRYRTKISGAPNFAYQLCVDKVTAAQKADLDLSGWRLAFCGAEPVRQETLDKFAAAFAPAGFKRHAFYPCYGLAEATLIVSGGDGPAELVVNSFDAQALTQNRAVPVTKGTDGAVTLVSNGSAMFQQQIRIADPDTLRACAPGEIGEIWVSGQSVAQGYWRRPEVNKQVFQARLAAGDEGPFLRTGDLGFLYEGELYVTGRLKDLIIIHGRNHYPQDIELTVGKCHRALAEGVGAAFSITEDGEEKLVIVNEVDRRHRQPNVGSVVAAIRRAVAREHQVQVQAVVLIKHLSVPRTSSGKIIRYACKQGFLEGTLNVVGEWHAGDDLDFSSANTAAQPVQTAASEPSVPLITTGGIAAGAIAEWLVAQVAQRLRLNPQRIDLHTPFVDYGLDSVQAVSMAGDLEIWLGRSLSPTLIWDYPTIGALAQHLAGEEQPQPQAQVAPDLSSEPIAVVGLGCRFPGADGPDAFWELLREGRDAIGEVPRERWDGEAYYAAGPEPQPGKMNSIWGGFLEQVDQFDASFFAIAPREATRMDPQQRLLLEVTWEALEHGGQNPAALADSATGVFIGISSSDYARRQYSSPELIDAYAGTGNAHSIAANRLSYTLDLRGPSIAIDTACSSSLVATHMAMNSLRYGESDLALAGGVNLILEPDLTITFAQARMMAADGRCKTFDARADGYVRGEGCGMLVLKRLSDAQRDGDPVLALLHGSAVNQDGRSNGLTAPHGPSQQAVIRRALQAAGLQAADISYVEAHGTGTPLGDPIEINSLQLVMDGQDEAGPLLVGSVKTNIGHLEAAAGVAGMIKTILALDHELIPPHLHFVELNPHINLQGSRLRIAAAATPWPRTKKARLAGVSSFGFGGTNAHIIVGEAPQRKVTDQALETDLFTISAREAKALDELAARYTSHLEENLDLSLAEICYSANTGRALFAQRLALTASSTADLQEQLQSFRSVSNSKRSKGPVPPQVAFLFTGQGAQYRGMGRMLFESEPVFRAVLEHCAALLADELDQPLLKIIFDTGDWAEADGRLLDQTSYTQPALFAFEYALAELWRSWGIEPDVVMGHSVGEYVAACVAGVMSLEDGLKLIAARGRLMGALPPGGTMAALFASEERVQTAVAPYAQELSVAGINGPASVVISGTKTAVSAVVAQLESEGVESRPLKVSHAFHSPLMEPVLEPFRQVAAGISYQAPRIPLISNLSGRYQQEAPAAAYWVQHLRRPVRFSDGLQLLADNGVTAFLEIGPQPHLTDMGKRLLKVTSPQVAAKALWLPSLRRKRGEREVLLDSLGKLFMAGLDIDWGNFYGERTQQKIALPTYPFQRERFWFDLDEQVGRSRISAPVAPRLTPGDGLGAVRRLQTAVPLFESWLELDETTDKMALLHANSVAVARLFWGEGAYQIADLHLTSRLLLSTGTLQTQTTITMTAADRAFFQTFGAGEEPDSWQLLAGGQLLRGPITQTERTAVAIEGTAGEPQRMPVAALPHPEGVPDRPTTAEDFAQYLQKQVAAVLDLNPARVALDQPLDTLGMDSLMAIELKNHLQQDWQIDLAVVELLQGPTIAQLAARLVTLLPSLRGDQPGQVPAIQPLTVTGEPGPLTYGQQAMWVLHQLLPPDVSFNVAGAARLRGDLDIPALRRAVEMLVQRHSSLRTTFSMIDGRPVQIVHHDWGERPLHAGNGSDGGKNGRTTLRNEAIFTVIDAVGWDQDAMESFLPREAYRPFDLEKGPLMRLVLLERGANEHLLLLSLNHLITDFWSMSLLVQDIYLLYSAELTGSSADLPQIKLQAADYALWQAEMLAGSEGEEHRRYWHEHLAGDLPRLDLPTDRPRPGTLTFDGGTESRHIEADLTARLKELGAREGATLATTLLAAFQTLLHRYTGQKDLLVGTVISGRERPELQDLVGYYINSVAIRADFAPVVGQDQAGAPAFLDVLAQTRQKMLEAITHQEYPLPLLAEELAAVGKMSVDPSRPPLFETMFIMQRAQVMAGEGLSAFALGVPGASLELGALQIESLPLGGLPAQFDLTLMMAEVDGGLTAALHYNKRLFDPQTVQRLLAHLEQLLQGAAADPQQPVNKIPLLPQQEREKLLHTWNDTAALYPHDKKLHELLLEQVARTPQKTALSFEGRQWTYAQLEEHSSRLARRLQQMGVGSGSLVALYTERSLEMVAGLLAILRAGGAYVPLDPDFPSERLALMLEDARPVVLLTQEHLAGYIPLPEGTAVCLIPTEAGIDAADGAAEQPAVAAHSWGVPNMDGDLAYVIYTSGSTGKPKGVQISHRAAVNFLWSMRREPGISDTDHILAVTTLSFDIALLELFLPLISGAQVTIVSREVAMDGYQLGRIIDEAGISIMQATPATWQMLLEAGWPGKDDLKVLCGGEALPTALAQELLARCGALWNMYGPTETTVWSTIERITRETGRITIGRPIANTQVYILDEEMQPVPTGVAGDLYIGGDGLACGYFNRPELTAQRFVAHPFAAGHRLYKTGDLARYLADGRILFLGRDDFQVKIRGYRIELGDIETAVSSHPAVVQNVCLAWEQRPTIRQLVDYIVPRPNQAVPPAAEMRGFLRAQLPDYMIPAHFIMLEALPLLPNGKVDRRALPDPAGRQIQTAAEHVPPRFELEEQVAELWSTILDLDEISIHDSFFDLGGNSLLATRLIFQTREQFKVQIPLRQVFIQPTVAGLSQAIIAAQQNGHYNGNGSYSIGKSREALPYGPPVDGQAPRESRLQAMSLEELKAEAVLDPAITGAGMPLAEIGVPRHVLLTGATGFVGAFLLRDLLHADEATIHCLVRAADDGEALARLKQNMITYGLWEDSFSERVKVLPGDLGRPLLGLAEEQFRELARRIDVIIHNGALVNFVYAYHDHKAPNVLGTQEVLRLACSEKLKALHFVSTLSVFHTGLDDDGRVFYEDDDLEQIGVPFGGYAQSKWVGEKMIRTAVERGIPAAIYRPGLVSGDSQSGVWNTADMMSTMTMACAAVGAVPDLDVNVDIVPVDYVSKALVTLALHVPPTGQIFNLCNPQTMPYKELLDLVRKAGLPLQAMPFEQWRGMLMQMAQQLGGENWNPYLPLLEEVTAEQIFMPAFDCRHTLDGLAGSGVTCPPVGQELLDTYLSFFQLKITANN